MGIKRKDNAGKATKAPSGVVLTACLMVKDEEEMLPRCLTSIRDHVDEIVVVDTGSTDKTVRIAQSYGARIYHHPWENDFSKHRNQSISYARGRWIFIIDADEECIVSSQRTMKDEIVLAEETGIDSLVMRVKNSMSAGRETVCNDSLRIFRNNGTIRYEGIVHNNLTGFTSAGASINYIIHYGYDQGTESTRKKFTRTATLLRKQIADDQTNAAAHMYLSSSYGSLDMYEDSLNEAAIAVDLVEAQGLTNKIYVRAYYGAIRALILLKRYTDAEQYCHRAISGFGPSIDIMAALTMIGYEKKEWERVLQYGNEYLQKLDQYMNYACKPELDHVATYGDSWKIYGWMGSAALKRGQIKKGEAYYRQASDLSPDKKPVFRHAGLALISVGEIDRSLPYLEEAYRLDGRQKDSRVVEAIFKIGILKGEAALIRRSLADALNMQDLSVPWLMELAAFASRHRDSESALVLYTKISELDENNVTAQLYLALQFLDRREIEVLVGLCDSLLKTLALPRDMTLNSIADLAELFVRIGDSLREHSRFADATLADTVAARLDGTGTRAVLS